MILRMPMMRRLRILGMAILFIAGARAMRWLWVNVQSTDVWMEADAGVMK